ncbi:MAG TPA: glycoside hydrolase [Candidatus Angelobacter sp.]|nr:glycoside hydrolase [Candidatus Angelobacter sp.]
MLFHSRWAMFPPSGPTVTGFVASTLFRRITPLRLLRAALSFLAFVLLTGHHARAGGPFQISLGRSAVDLNGPWKFHIGDNPAWSDPKFEDSSWETVDLTAPPGAHDDDVGLTGYVPGWSAKGHLGYSGYAWYRLRVAVTAPEHAELALTGPPAVDSAYQIFVNGKLMGSAGRFSGPVPTVFSIQPRLFAIGRWPGPTSESDDPDLLIAFRVWMGSWDLGEIAGGIHIAPVLGDTGSIQARYQMQWLQTIRGYIVEVVEGLFFLLLAAMAWCLRSFDRSNRAYLWLCTALVLTALYRANQAIFFWGQFETVHGFELISIVLLLPLCLAAWTLAWRAWLRPGMEWMPTAAGGLLAFYILAEFLSRSWFYGVFPQWFNRGTHFAIASDRLLFLALTVLITYRGIQQRRDTWFTISALLLVSVGLFAQELSQLGIKGIWFPFGTGVSRTQFAYAVFDLVMFALLWNRFQHFAKRYRSPAHDATSA